MFHNEHIPALWEQKVISRAARLAGHSVVSPPHATRLDCGARPKRQPGNVLHRTALAGHGSRGKSRSATLEQRLVTLFFD